MKIVKKEISFTVEDRTNIEVLMKRFENMIYNSDLDIINNPYISETVIKQIDYPDPDTSNDDEIEKWLDKANEITEINSLEITYDTAIKLSQYLSKGKTTEVFKEVNSEPKWQIIIKE